MRSIKDEIAAIFPEESDIPEKFRISSPVVQNEYLINGDLRRWSGPMQDVLSPVCVKTPSGAAQKMIGKFPLLTEKEALEALGAAVQAYDSGWGVWPTMSVEERVRHIGDFLNKMKLKKAEVVKLLMWEIGKPLADAEKEFDRTAEYIQDTIESLKDLDRASSRFSIQQGIIAQIRRAPLGVVLCMGPYNYPLNETFTTLIPALIMGNTVVFKPPRHGVLLHRPLLDALQKSFPKGVVNTIYGEGRKIIPPLMASGKVAAFAFIGSSLAADSLKKNHPKPHRLRCILGLEAKNAGIILSDADIDLAVRECILGTLSYNGQRCTGLKMLFVHNKVVSLFNKKFTDEISRLKFGMPWETGVSLTPLPEPEKVAYLTELAEDAVSQGAGVMNEDGGVTNGTFFYPAVLFPVNSRMRIYAEEQFGPVIPIIPFENIEEPAKYVTDSNYGQQVSIFGKNPDVMADLIDPLVNQVCRVNINSQCQRGPDTFPFTGRKDSAEGTLSVSDALRVFSIRTLVAAKGSDANKEIVSAIVKGRKSNFLSTDFIL
jgi:glyceraldehyde-3-phosphate dehydrogenase (NADP+)